MGKFSHNLRQYQFEFASWLVTQGYGIILYPMGGGDPHADFYAKLVAAFPGASVLYLSSMSFEEVLLVCKAAHISSGVRLHSNILCASTAAPHLALMYSLKCLDFALST